MSNLGSAIYKRFRNYAFWVSLLSLIPLICQVFQIASLPKNYSVICNTLLSLLVAAGIVNNPVTDNRGYADDITDNSKLELGKKDNIN